MNAGLMADCPDLENSGAEGVGLFRTELQFLTRTHMPRRGELAGLYAHVLDSAHGKPVMFRTLDIGSDKVLPYMKPQDEPNPAMGWRAIRVGLDKRGVLQMQLQALIRAAVGRPLYGHVPFHHRDGRVRGRPSPGVGADGPRAASGPCHALGDPGRGDARDAGAGLCAERVLRDVRFRLGGGQ